MRRDPEHLLTCGEIALSNGYFTRLRLIDSDLKAYAVLEASKVGYVGLFGGWRLFYASRKIRVQLSLGPPTRVSLDEVKESVITTMRLDRDFWESAGDLEEQAVEIRAIETFDDLVWRFA